MSYLPESLMGDYARYCDETDRQDREYHDTYKAPLEDTPKIETPISERPNKKESFIKKILNKIFRKLRDLARR
jgi:hypothetical protein